MAFYLLAVQVVFSEGNTGTTSIIPETAAEPPVNNEINLNNGIIASVNRQIITRRSVEKQQKLLRIDKSKALETLIEDELFWQAAQKEKVTILESELEKELQEQINKAGSLEIFTKEVLRPMENTMEEYRSDLQKNLLWQKYIFLKTNQSDLKTSHSPLDVLIDTFVSPREIKAYFEEYRHELTDPEKIKTRQIILRFDDNINREIKKMLADEIYADLQKKDETTVESRPNREDSVSPADKFITLARKYSELKTDSGGDWDWTERGSFPPEVENIIYTLPVNGLSPVIETKNTFRIVRVEEKNTPANNFDNPDIQDKMHHKLKNKKKRDGIGRLRKKLWDQADIRYFKP